MAEDKGKYNKLTQAQFEAKMQGFADSLKKETERMTKARQKFWSGQIKDAPSADVTEAKINKKEKK